MTGTEFRSALKAAGIRHRWLADRLGVNETTVWRWCSGALEVPRYATSYVELWRELQAKGKGTGGKTIKLSYQIAQLRHAYAQLKAAEVKHQALFADGLIGPVIAALERF